MRVYLIEPHSGGRISGGFLYNAKIAEFEPRVERRAVRPDRLEDDLRALTFPEPAWLLADSLFLNAEQLGIFQRFRSGSGHGLGLLLHAFPSFIQAAEDRGALERALPLSPTDVELTLLDALDVVVTPGPYAPRLLEAGGARVPAVICPPGVDAEPLSPRTQSESAAQRVELVSIGGVTPLKGLLDAADALSRLRSADFRWTIVGNLDVAPDHVAELRARTHALGLGERVVFAGQRAHEETLATLRASDLMLLPSYTENHPLVALEALAAGVPVVGYEVGGLPDIVRHDEQGLLAPLLDIAGLARVLDILIVNAALRRRLADGCIRKAREFPSWREAARGFHRALEERRW
jgi:glycosyltransferase involved in cell wall biosynthesis